MATNTNSNSNANYHHRSSSAPRSSSSASTNKATSSAANANNTATSTSSTASTMNHHHTSNNNNNNTTTASHHHHHHHHATTTTPLHVRYPVNAVVELILAPTAEQVQGTVYTTDDISNSVVLQKSLVHTTLANEIRVIHAASIVSCTILSASPTTTTDNNVADFSNNNAVTTATTDPSSLANHTTTTPTSNKSTNHNNNNNNALTLALDSLSSPLPTISRKTLEEREKRAMRLAEESLRHINQKASPEGQVTFDRLLKACNEVIWSGESIIVLGHIQVDPPYGPEQCQLLPTVDEAPLHSQENLERVRKIVASVTNNTTTTPMMSRSNSSSTSP